VIVCVEIVNFIAIMSSQTVVNVVMNFLALVVISEFDDFFYQALGDDDCKIFLQDPSFADIVKIERTTSSRATDQIPEHQLTKQAINIPDEAERVLLEAAGEIPRYIFCDFRSRSLLNMAGMLLYRAMRTVYVTAWFYFLPFLILFGSYYVPYYLQMFEATN
jgi:hypothetical protein